MKKYAIAFTLLFGTHLWAQKTMNTECGSDVELEKINSLSAQDRSYQDYHLKTTASGKIPIAVHILRYKDFGGDTTLSMSELQAKKLVEQANDAFPDFLQFEISGDVRLIENDNNGAVDLSQFHNEAWL